MSSNARFAIGVTVYILCMAAVTWIIGAMFGGCGGPLVRPAPLVRYVDEADAVRVALADVWYATALVKVTADPEEYTARGSGVVVSVGEAGAFLLTADHVVAPDDAAKRIAVWITFPDGKMFLGQVWREDYRHDLAIVEVFGHVGASPIRMAEAAPRLMSRVWSFGAVDADVGQVGAARWGKLRPARGYPSTLREVTGGFIWPGMSGGPVVDERGGLVGVIDAAHITDALDEGEDDNDPMVLVPQMGAAVDWTDVAEFLRDAGMR